MDLRIIIGIIVVMVFSCRNKADSRSDFFTHYNGEEFVKTHKVGEYKVTCTYQTPYFLACKELSYLELNSKIDSVQATYEGGLQFVIDIQSDNGLLIESILNSNTNQVVEQQLKKSFYLVYGDYEQKPSFVHVVRGSLVANKVQMLVCFSKEQENINEVTVVFKDYLFGVGQLNYNYALQEIKELAYPVEGEK